MAYDDVTSGGGGEKSDDTRDLVDLKKRVVAQISKSRLDRMDRAPLINEVYRLSSPWKHDVSSNRGSTTKLTSDEVVDIVDSTLMVARRDFASEMMALFTPPGESWTKLTPVAPLGELRADEKTRFEEGLAGVTEWLFDDLSTSTYYDAGMECFQDLSTGTMALYVNDYGAAEPLVFEPVELSKLLLHCGPQRSADARYIEGKITRGEYISRYGEKFPKPRCFLVSERDDASCEIYDGFHRVWSRRNEEVWRRVIFADDEIVYEKVLDGEGLGGCRLIAARWEVDSLNAYGIGPAFFACPAQRALNEIKALSIIRLAKMTDPVTYLEDNGVINLEQGLEPGDYVSVDEGFKLHQEEPKGDLNAEFFAVEDLVMQIRDALYQAKPEQKGKTPPTAEQWSALENRNLARFELPRGKISREWVLPIVRVSMNLRASHGLLPKLVVRGDSIQLRPEMPFVKARVADKTMLAKDLLITFQSLLGPEEFASTVDAGQTLKNIQALVNDRLVVVRSPEEIEAMRQQRGIEQAAVQNAGQIAQAAGGMQ